MLNLLFDDLFIRVLLATFTGFALLLMLMPAGIRKLAWLQSFNTVRQLHYDAEQHKKKSETPTMGGILVLLVIIFSSLIWADLGSRYIWMVILTTLAFGLIGFMDDYLKIKSKGYNGLSLWQKFFWQSLVAIGLGVWIYNNAQSASAREIIFPLLSEVTLDLGLGYILFGYFVIVGSSNATNITDGLDGLAIMPIVMIATALGFLAYLAGSGEYANFFNIPFVEEAQELSVFCAAIAGAGLGFLWFNAYPAKVFMGDVGALALGAVLGFIALVIRHEILFAVMAGIFVIETLSVIIQIFSYRVFSRRVFLVAPLHHHLQAKGWTETSIVIRFWIISLLLVAGALSTIGYR